MDFILTDEICELVGAFMGDGCLYKTRDNHYRIQFTGHAILDRNYYEKVICPIILKNFNAKTGFRIISKTNILRVNISSKKLYLFLIKFLSLKSSNKTYTVKIPKFLFLSKNRKFLNSLIRGLYDTDGGIFLDKRECYKVVYPRVLFYTSSEILYLQLCDYLSKYFNIYSSSRKRKGYNNKSYSIDIYGKHQLFKWMSKIGFSNKRHISKLAHVA